MASKLAVCARAEPTRARKAAEMVNCIFSDYGVILFFFWLKRDFVFE